MKENGERKVAMVTGSLGTSWRTAGCLPELSRHSVVEEAKHLSPIPVSFGEAAPDILGIPNCDSASSWATGSPSAKDTDVQTGKLGVDTVGPAWCEQG